MGNSMQEFSFLWKTIHVFLALFFSLACFVNRNDPDWYLWMPMYFIPALLCFSAALKPSFTLDKTLWYWVATALFYGCLVYAIYEVFALTAVFASHGVNNPFVFEEGRELGGLTIIVTWTGMVLSNSGSSQSSQKPVSSMPWIVAVVAVVAVVPLLFWSLCYIPGVGSSMGHCIGMKSC